MNFSQASALSIRDEVPDELEDIYGHLGRNEACLLYYLASLIPEGGTIVEIGSYLGKSAAYLASGMGERGIYIYAVDTWDNRTMPIESFDTLPTFLDNIERWKENIVPLRQVSWEAGLVWDGPKIDLWFHDGDHSYEAVKADFRVWSEHLKQYAFVALHDYDNPYGVRQAAEELIVPVCDFLIQVDNLWVGQLRDFVVIEQTLLTER